ncbi:MAG: type IV pilus assembly protein PilM, partial [Pseudomonadota bacterium]
MIFAKKDHLVGLDIGSSFIKVAELKATGNGLALHKFGMARIAPGTIVEGRVMDMEGLANDIQALFKSQKIREKNVAISTGGHSVVIKTINMAMRPEKELHDMIFSEAEQYIPYDIDDVNIDYQVLGESEFSPDQVSVLLVAVKKDLVAEYIDLIQMAGLNPRIIDVDTFALQNAYEILPYGNQEKITLLIDVGASKTSLNIVKAKVSLMMRDTVLGANQVIEALSEQLEISVEDAQDALNGDLEGIVSADDLERISVRVAQSWCSEICEVVNTFQSGANDERVEKILLSGGGVFVE